MMKKTAKVFLVITLFTVFITLLSGCGGNSLDGVWGCGEGSVTYEFSGNNVTQTNTFSGRMMMIPIYGMYFNSTRGHGTFSLTDTQIEFVWTGDIYFLLNGEVIHSSQSTSSIQVERFSRTENTITIAGRRFTRQ